MSWSGEGWIIIIQLFAGIVGLLVMLTMHNFRGFNPVGNFSRNSRNTIQDIRNTRLINMSSLKIFVSSTCYDLSQVRADLYDFISGLGYQPILSEYPSFPVDPDEDTISNCIQNVETADIFILIIGGRYGSLVDSGKSITNTEYMHARNRGIPVYVFIQRSVIGMLGFWESNPDSDFSKYVDSTRVFEFVKEVREKLIETGVGSLIGSRMFIL